MPTPKIYDAERDEWIAPRERYQKARKVADRMANERQFARRLHAVKTPAAPAIRPAVLAWSIGAILAALALAPVATFAVSILGS